MSEINANVLNETQTCPAVGYQSASICVPVTVTPFAPTGVTMTKCCGEPVVTPGREVCGGLKNGSCVFTITQDICVAVPVEFGAIATVGDTSSAATVLPSGIYAPTAKKFRSPKSDLPTIIQAPERAAEPFRRFLCV